MCTRACSAMLCVLSRTLVSCRGFDMLEGYPKLQAYRAALVEHPAVKSTINPPEGQDWLPATVKAYAGYGGQPVNYF